MVEWSLRCLHRRDTVCEKASWTYLAGARVLGSVLCRLVCNWKTIFGAVLSYVDIDRHSSCEPRPRAGAAFVIRVEHVLIYTALY
jgi:hypothetical protein